MDGYNHISFRREWEITVDSAYLLGECHALVHALTDIPLLPEYRQRLLNVSLRKGAQATTQLKATHSVKKKLKGCRKVGACRQVKSIYKLR